MSKLGNILMAAIDLGLLAVILTSYQEQKQSTSSISSFSSESVISQDTIYSSEPISADQSFSAEQIDSYQETYAEEETQGGSGRLDYDTSEPPAAEDFEWVTYDTLQGFIPSDAQLLDFTDITGGWKAYLITDPDNANDSKVEQYLNAYIDGSGQDVTVTLDWYYSYVYSVEEGYDDTSPDSVFSGTWEDRGIRAVGPGRLELHTFYFYKDSEFVIGNVMWPDGMQGVITLVRP